MSQTISPRLEFLRALKAPVEGLLESRLHRKGARSVRRGLRHEVVYVSVMAELGRT